MKFYVYWKKIKRYWKKYRMNLRVQRWPVTNKQTDKWSRAKAKLERLFFRSK